MYKLGALQAALVCRLQNMSNSSKQCDQNSALQRPLLAAVAAIAAKEVVAVRCSECRALALLPPGNLLSQC